MIGFLTLSGCKNLVLDSNNFALIRTQFWSDLSSDQNLILKQTNIFIFMSYGFHQTRPEMNCSCELLVKRMPILLQKLIGIFVSLNLLFLVKYDVMMYNFDSYKSDYCSKSKPVSKHIFTLDMIQDSRFHWMSSVEMSNWRIFFP